MTFPSNYTLSRDGEPVACPQAELNNLVNHLDTHAHSTNSNGKVQQTTTQEQTQPVALGLSEPMPAASPTRPHQRTPRDYHPMARIGGMRPHTNGNGIASILNVAANIAHTEMITAHIAQNQKEIAVINSAHSAIDRGMRTANFGSIITFVNDALDSHDTTTIEIAKEALAHYLDIIGPLSNPNASKAEIEQFVSKLPNNTVLKDFLYFVTARLYQTSNTVSESLIRHDANPTAVVDNQGISTLTHQFYELDYTTLQSILTAALNSDHSRGDRLDLASVDQNGYSLTHDLMMSIMDRIGSEAPPSATALNQFFTCLSDCLDEGEVGRLLQQSNNSITPASLAQLYEYQSPPPIELLQSVFNFVHGHTDNSRTANRQVHTNTTGQKAHLIGMQQPQATKRKQPPTDQTQKFKKVRFETNNRDTKRSIPTRQANRTLNQKASTPQLTGESTTVKLKNSQTSTYAEISSAELVKLRRRSSDSETVSSAAATAVQPIQSQYTERKPARKLKNDTGNTHTITSSTNNTAQATKYNPARDKNFPIAYLQVKGQTGEIITYPEEGYKDYRVNINTKESLPNGISNREVIIQTNRFLNISEQDREDHFREYCDVIDNKVYAKRFIPAGTVIGVFAGVTFLKSDVKILAQTLNQSEAAIMKHARSIDKHTSTNRPQMFISPQGTGNLTASIRDVQRPETTGNIAIARKMTSIVEEEDDSNYCDCLAHYTLEGITAGTELIIQLS